MDEQQIKAAQAEYEKLMAELRKKIEKQKKFAGLLKKKVKELTRPLKDLPD